MSDAPMTVFLVALTIAIYAASRGLFLRTRLVLLNPVLVSTACIVAVLAATGVGAHQYRPGRDLVTALLGPATVALAVPLYRHRHRLVTHAAPIALGIACGSATTIATVVVLARCASLERALVLAVAPNSVTAPVAIEIANGLGGNVSLTAVLVVLTGMVGAMVGPRLLTAVRISDPVARGIAIGTTSHAQGTAAILEEGETQGAMAAIALAVAAIFAAFVGPFLIPWLAAVGR